MAFCNKCGSEINGNSSFCSNCGAKIVTSKQAGQLGGASAGSASSGATYVAPISVEPTTPVEKPKPKARIGMKTTAIVFFVLSVILFFAFLDGDMHILDPIIALVVSGLFTCLAFSPKSSPYMFGMKKGIKKNIFVIIYTLFIIFLIVNSPSSSEEAMVTIVKGL